MRYVVRLNLLRGTTIPIIGTHERTLIIDSKSRKGKARSQTLYRGLKILEVIASGNRSLSIRELADQMNFPRTVVHRLISTLEDEGYLSKNSFRAGYKISTKMWSLGSAAIQNLEIRDVARRYIENLALKTNELVALAILEGKEIVYIDKIDSSQTVRAIIPIGGRAPAYCLSTGKAILAYRNDEEIVKLASSMKKFTHKTMADREALKKDLAEVRRRGYSINFGEWHDDVGGVASAVRDREGTVVAAICITVPVHRLTKANTDRFGRLTMEAARRISTELGYGEFKRQSLVK